MSEQDQERINRAADGMYDAIREYEQAAGFDAVARADRRLSAAADAYDTAIEQCGPSKYVRPVDVSRN